MRLRKSRAPTNRDLHRVDNYEVLQLRNQVLPLVRMGRRGTERTDHRAGKIFILVISFGERKLGLIVDAMEGEEELVIKTLWTIRPWPPTWSAGPRFWVTAAWC